ncbi:MAG: 30S ribosomal protein S19 [Candidatus Diapherotrites archaeon]|nr:30S ribosomal protein S19 [Candidatus Diapherotrites archaeon]
MVREFTFRGKTLDELMKMSYQEFAQLCNARARRSLLRRGVDKKLEKNIMLARKKLEEGVKDLKPIRTHKRDTVIVPQMVGLKFGVYNGKEFVVVEVTPEMLGHYLGEFALTRKKLKHGKAGIGATRSSTAIARK